MLKAFLDYIVSLLKYTCFFFFNKTRALKNKSFWLFFLSLSDREIVEPFCECSFLQQQVPLFSAILLLSSLLAYMYFFYIWWCFKHRNQIKNKLFVNWYLKLVPFTFFSVSVVRFFLFDEVCAIFFFFNFKLASKFRAASIIFNKFFTNNKIEPIFTKISQFVNKKK